MQTAPAIRFIAILAMTVWNINCFSQQVDSITDIRDHQKYHVVKIGEQWWMKENLNAATYMNGDPIPNITDNNTWEYQSVGARCYYNNDSINFSGVYGALYNWFTVSNNFKLCPAGWHVPGDLEWHTLVNYLGGEDAAGGKMKEIGTNHWLDPNNGASNISGFTALPGVARDYYGTCGMIGSYGTWWSSTEYDASSASFRRIFNYSSYVDNGENHSKVIGRSIRCIYNFNTYSDLSILDNNFQHFNNLFLNNKESLKTLVLINQSYDTVLISNVYTKLNAFRLNFTPTNLIPGDSIHFILSFSPSNIGFFQDTLFIQSSDSYEAIRKIPLLGIWTNPICGVIPSDSILTKADSPYFITPTNQFCRNLGVDAGVILTIEPGVTVFIDSMAQMIVDGKLIANGTEEEPITFINEGDDVFNQIYFRSAVSSSLKNVIIKGGNRGIFAENTTLDLNNLAISECSNAIDLSNCYATISGVNFTNNQGSVTISGTSQGSIQNCVFINNGNGISIPGGTFDIDNNFLDNSGNGISVINNTGKIISNNTVKNCTTGISSSNSSIIENNTVEDIWGEGIQVTNSIVKNNVIKNCGNAGAAAGYGLSVTNCTLVEGNYISNSFNTGITGSNSKIISNTLTQNNNAGIAGDGLEIRNNIINNNFGTGIISSGNSTIISNKIYENTVGGISSSGNTLIKSNQVINNTGNGIYCSGVNTIDANRISGNSGDGLKETSSSQIKNNDIFGNGGDGIETSALPTVNYNNIYSNTGFNFRASKQANDTINAWHNYWGTSTISLIRAGIYDYTDDGVTVKVRFGDFKTTELALKSVENFTSTTLSGGQVKLTWDMHPKAFQYYLYHDNQTGNIDSSSTWIVVDSSKISHTGTLPDGDYIFGIKAVAFNDVTGIISQTPGLADGTPPVLLDAYGEAGDSVMTLTASEELDENTGSNTNNWALSNSLTIDRIFLSNNGVPWHSKSPMPTARYGSTSSVVNGKIYVIGGFNLEGGTASYKQIVEEYDPVSDTWLTKSPMPTPRSSFTSEVINGKIYAIGGENSNSFLLKTVEEFDPVTDTWQTKSPLQSGRKYAASGVVNGKIYVMGGINSNTVEEYNPAANSWQNKSSMPTDRYGLTTSVLNGKIYAIGGYSNGSYQNTAETYNPSDNSWFTAEPMPTPRGFLTSAAVNGKIVVMGGRNSDYGLNIVEEYDPLTNKWKTSEPVPTSRHSLTSAVSAGKVYVIGGYGSGYLNILEVYNPFDKNTLALEDVLPSSNTAINLTVSTISDIYGNTSGPQTITFYPDDGNKNPVLAINSTPGELSGDISFNYTISDTEKDILKIKPEYSSDGGNTWQLAAITGDTINLDSTKYSGYIIWHSYTNLPGLEKTNIRFRIIPRDADPRHAGTPGITNKLIIDNNLNPLAAIQELVGEVNDTVSISFSLSDAENDILKIHPEYYDNSLKTWRRATIIGDTVGFVPGAYVLKWLSKTDLPSGAMVVPFRISPFDNEYGTSDTVDLVLDNIGVCSVQLTNIIPAETGGNIVFNYLVSDDENDVIDLEVKYSKDNGGTWLSPATTGTLTGLTPAQYTGSFTWNTTNNFNGTDFTNIKWRIIPHDANPGIKAEGIVHIDNNIPPSISLQNVNGLRRGNIFLHYGLTDTEGNSLNLAARTYVNGQWINCTLTGNTTGIMPAYYTGTVTWNSAADIPDADGSYKLVLIPFDNDEGSADTIDVQLNNMSVINLGGNTSLCQGQSRVLDARVEYLSYLWSTGETGQSISVTSPGTYWVKAVDNHSKTHYCDTINIIVNPLPEPDLGSDVFLCQGQQVTLSPGSFTSYNWSTGYAGSTLNVNSTGTYSVTVSDGNGCQKSDTVNVFVQSPFGGEQICFVTANKQSNNNVIVWEKTPGAGTAFYSVYRENTQGGYVVIGTADYNGAGIFVDSMSFPDQLNYSYKLSLTDTCGHESGLSPAHGSIYLKVNKGSGGFDLTWTAYQGIEVAKYEVYRGSDSVNLLKVKDIAGSISSWSDNYVPQCVVYYQVRANVASACISAGSPDYTGIESNIAGNGAVKPRPVIMGPVSFCDGEQTTLDAGNFSSYLWSNGRTTQTIQISAGGIFSVTVSNESGCYGTSEQFTASIATSPQFELGKDTAVCGAQIMTLSGPSGLKSYLWDNSSSQKDRSVSATGLYKLTVTDHNGCKGSDEILITYNNLPAPNLNTSEYICPGGQASLDPGQFTSYLWNTGATTRVLTATASGTYKVTVTDVNNCTNYDEVALYNYANPNISLGTDVAICQDTSWQFDAGNFNSYQWSDGKNTQSITTNIQGNYWVKVNDGHGCNWTSDTVHLAINNLPQIKLGNDTSLCGAQNFLITGPSGYASYSWDNGSAQKDRAISSTGLFKLKVTDSNGCKGSDEILVTYNNLPAPNLNTSEYICPGGQASLDPGQFTSYLWNTGATSRVLTATTAGTYSVSVSDVNGCKNSDEVVVYNYVNPDISLGPDVAICRDTTWMFDAGNYNTYLWSNGKTTQSVTTNVQANYWVKVSDSHSCVWTSDTVYLSVNNLPQFDLGKDTSVCGAQNLIIIGPSGFSSYNWDNGSSQKDRTVSATGLYKLKVTDNNSCKSTDEILVTYQSLPVINLDPIEYICGGEPSYLDPGEFVSYNWSNGSTDRIQKVSVAQTLDITVTDVHNCTSSKQVKIETKSGSKVDLGTDFSICQGDSAELSPKSTYVSYLWSNGETNESIRVSKEGNYALQATDIFNCKSSDTIYLSVLPLPVSPNLGPERIICYGDQLTLDAGAGYSSYLWNNELTTRTIKVDTTGTYSVSAFAENGCSNKTSVRIKTVVPYSGQKICMVTVDGGNNLVIWEKPDLSSIEQFLIYRESDFAGEYELIGVQSPGQLSVFADAASNPQEKSDRYRISVIDTCANESPMSEEHKTMHLNINLGLNGEVNLIWENYEGMLFGTYEIYRGSAADNLELIKTIQSSITSFTDTNVPSGTLFYQVAIIKPDPCDPAGLLGKKAGTGPYAKSVSNIKESKQQNIGINSLLAGEVKLTVYPNPFTDFTTINYTLEKQTKMVVEIYNVVGEKIKILQEKDQSAGTYKLEMKAVDVNYKPGIYYLKIMVDDRVIMRKAMLTR